MIRVAITGANGFIGQNLRAHLNERADIAAVAIDRTGDLAVQLADADVVVHLAGINRPDDAAEFTTGNADYTDRLCAALGDRAVPILYASSTQAANDSPYGRSKRAAEDRLRDHAMGSGAAVAVFRLPGVFGKWARPGYNSVVATFCHNIARDLAITVRDPAFAVDLVYVDDVVARFVALIDGGARFSATMTVDPVYRITLGDLADTLRAFRASRQTLVTEAVGHGLLRALHATYLTYLPHDAFSYAIPTHGDARGMFAEIVKTHDAGQVSFFTALPGVTRGGHYHHSKVEKFLVVRGRAHFRFRHLMTGDTVSLDTDADHPRIVETIPGWVHDITNTGDDDLICVLWANEIFDRAAPDTYAAAMTGGSA